MKKILALLLAVLLILAMVIPAFAVTPDLGAPDVPEIPDISDDVEIELPEDIFDGYIPDIDIDIEIELPEDPTDPPAEPPIEPPHFNYCEFLKGWFEWWMHIWCHRYG